MSSDDSGSLDIDPTIVAHYQHVQDVDESIFLALQVVGGHILLPLLVLTIVLSRKVKRHPVFINFCVSWIFSSIMYSLLVYRGRSRDDDLSLDPDGDTCLIQAALLNGAQALTTCTSLALVLHLWYILRNALLSADTSTETASRRRWDMAFNSLLIITPFIAFLTFTITTVTIGSAPADDPDGNPVPGSNLAIPGVFYCIILQNANLSQSIAAGFKLLRAVYIFSMVVAFISFGFEVLVAYRIYQRRRAIKGSVSSGWSSLFLRVIFFSIYRVVALGLNMAIILNPDEIILTGISSDNLYNGAIDFLQSAIPLVAFLAFATTADVFDVWCFWKKKESQPFQRTEKSTETASQSETHLVGFRASEDSVGVRSDAESVVSTRSQT